MMTAQTSGYPLPALPSHRLSGHHYYDPPFQISGALAGIAESGPFPFFPAGEYNYVQFISSMNLRESPSTKAKKLGTVKTNVSYYIDSRTWEKNPEGKIAIVGGTDRCWYRLLSVDEKGTIGDPVGWACAAENVKTSDTGYLTVGYAVQKKDAAPLSGDQVATYKKNKDDALKLYKKLTATGGGGGGGGGGSIPAPPSGEALGAEEGGIGTGMTIALGLGVAALVYYLILQGKKK